MSESSKKPSVKQGKRRRARILAFQTLYGWDISKNTLDDLLNFSWMKQEEDQEVITFATLIIAGVLENCDEIDKNIESKLTGWNLERLSRVDLAILRVGAYSLLFQKDIPHNVTINEAVEMAKEYSAPESYKFINAVMDGLRKAML